MKKVTKKELRKTALKLLPAIYDSAMRTGAEDGLFQHEDWRTGLCLDAFLLAEAFENAAAYRDAEPEPKLKQLDQSVFSQPYVDDRFNYVALNADGQSIFFEQKPSVSVNLDIWVATGGSILPMLKGYDATDWQNSLIERKELTGSDLARAMLERGDKWVLCFIGDTSEPATIARGSARIVIGIRKDRFETDNTAWKVAIPINSQGEPLTQSDVGL